MDSRIPTLESEIESLRHALTLERAKFSQYFQALAGRADGPKVERDGAGREFLNCVDGFRMTCGIGPEARGGLLMEDRHGDAVFVPHTTLCSILPALFAYAAHRSFTVPTERPGIQSAASGGLT